MAIRKTFLGLVAALAVSGCASTSQGPAKALPPAFIDGVMESAMAQTIAEECPSLRYNQSREDRVMMGYARQLAAAGYTGRDFDVAARNVSRSPDMQRKAVKMIVSRGIDPSSQASWCAAGRREKARGTNIGRYLI